MFQINQKFLNILASFAISLKQKKPIKFNY